MESETCRSCDFFIACDLKGHEEVGWCDDCKEFTTAESELCLGEQERRAWCSGEW